MVPLVHRHMVTRMQLCVIEAGLLQLTAAMARFVDQQPVFKHTFQKTRFYVFKDMSKTSSKFENDYCTEWS